MNVLITCPPMILRLEHCKDLLKDYNVTVPKFRQTMSEESLIDIIGDYDAWIAGDDPVTRKVLESSKRLKTVIKWGIGTDNIDFQAIHDLNINFSNTPGMFGNEVADVAIGYLIGLTRELFRINNEVRQGNWIKPSGISLANKKVALLGFGDIGRNIASRLLALKMNVFVSDPGFIQLDSKIICKYNEKLRIDQELYKVKITDLDTALSNSDILILSCPLNDHTYHIIDNSKISLMNNDSYIVNVSRGPVVNEIDIILNLKNNKLKGFASDVFEIEPIQIDYELLSFPNVIVGSHNASNTIDAVDKTNLKAINLVKKYLN